MLLQCLDPRRQRAADRKPTVYATRKFRRLGVAAAVLAGACMAAEVRVVGPGTPGSGTGTGGGGGPGFTLTLTPFGGTLAVNTALQLVPTLRDAQGAPVAITTITWATSNSNIIAVDQTGRVLGVNLGSATVTASTAGTAATATFTVVQTPVASVVVSPATATLQLGSSAQLSAIVRDAAQNTLSGRIVTWSSSNAAVATVDANGLARATGTGSATITAASEGRTGTAQLTVQNVPVATVQVMPAVDTVHIGRQTQLVAILRDGSGNVLSSRVVTWSNNATSVARVSGNGLIDGLAAGTATITATSEGQTGTATIVVIPVPVATVVVVPQAVTVQVGATTTFAGTPRDANGNALSGRTVVWSSDNTSIAQVSASGVVSGIAPGSALIMATCEGVVGSAFVTVTAAAATLVAVTIAPQTAALQSGQTQQFTLTGTLSDNSTVPVSGTFTATSGTVNGAGIYTAPDASGTFLVIGTATGTSLRDTASVTVTRPPVATVQVTPASGTVNVNQTLGFTATTNASYPNEPVGAVVLMDYDTDFGNPGNPPWGYMSGNSNLSTITDVTAPVNPAKVGRVRFSTGCCNGTGPARLETYNGSGRGTPPSNWSRWYVSDWIKYDAAFTPHECCHKIFEFYIGGSGAGTWVLVKADPNNGRFPLQPRFTTEYLATGAANWNQANFQIQAGVWYQYEVIVNRSGRLQMWVRQQGGSPVQIYDGTPPGMGTPSASFLFWWWGYGGLGSYAGPTSYIYHNHMRASYVP